MMEIVWDQRKGLTEFVVKGLFWRSCRGSPVRDFILFVYFHDSWTKPVW